MKGKCTILYGMAKYLCLKPNSWTYNFIEVSGSLSSQTWSFREQCYRTNQFHTTIAQSEGGGVNSLVEVTANSSEEITSKNSASVRVLQNTFALAAAFVHKRTREKIGKIRRAFRCMYRQELRPLRQPCCGVCSTSPSMPRCRRSASRKSVLRSEPSLAQTRGWMHELQNLSFEKQRKAIPNPFNFLLLIAFLCGRCLSVWDPAQNPIPHPPPLHTVYVYTSYLFTQGRGGGRVEPQRMLDRQQFTKLVWKYQHDWLYL
jgi:hypothetical protein